MESKYSCRAVMIPESLVSLWKCFLSRITAGWSTIWEVRKIALQSIFAKSPISSQRIDNQDWNLLPSLITRWGDWSSPWFRREPRCWFLLPKWALKGYCKQQSEVDSLSHSQYPCFCCCLLVAGGLWPHR